MNESNDTGCAMKRVLFVATTPFAVNAFLRPHLLTLSRDFSVTLCVNLDAHPISPDLKDVVEIVGLGFQRKISLVEDVLSLIRLLCLIWRLKPDVVHSITPKAGLLAMVASGILRVPHRFHTFTGQVWATKSGVFRWILMRMDRVISGFATRIFADSGSQARYLEAQKIAGTKHVEVLGGGSIAGVDLDRFRPNPVVKADLRRSVGCHEQAFVFLFMGRITREKGVIDLIDAFSRVVDSGVAAELWLAGPDEDGLWAGIADEIADCPSPMRYWGSTNEPEKFMGACDMLVLPSYREGFGSVVIEAAACEVPTIAYRINGVIDAVEEGVSGALVDVGDIAALAESMASFSKRKELVQAMGIRARERAVARFSTQKVTAAWRALYMEIN